jgi:hypothetical protein
MEFLVGTGGQIESLLGTATTDLEEKTEMMAPGDRAKDQAVQLEARLLTSVTRMVDS